MSGPRAAPHPPPSRGGTATPTARARRTGVRRRHEGGQEGVPQAATQNVRREAAERPPPPNPPHRPASRGGPGPHPPRQGGSVPPPPERGAGARPAPPPQPPAPAGATENKRARANAPGRRTDRAQRRRASTNRSGMGGHAPHGRNDASDTRIVACTGKAEGGNEAERPPALQAPPWPHKRGVRRTPPPPKPAPGTRTPRTRPAARSPHRACRPRGQRRAPIPARPRPQHVDSGPEQPPQWAGSRGRGSA